ncbi:TPA: ribitol-5-phosphate dehydrogenase, partial [Listeria monocytogenes]|nr:ribitol-5-phosphate dehydrogenase [Listeria monocytogenes]
SGKEDFQNTVNFLSENERAVEYLSSLIGQRKVVRNLQDIIEAFETDLRNPFGKTVMEWKV